MGPKLGAEEDEPELFLLPLAHSRTHLTTVLFWGEIWVHEDDPTHHVHPSMLCHAQPPGLVVITCVTARAVFRTNAGFAGSLRTLNFFGLYI